MSLDGAVRHSSSTGTLRKADKRTVSKPGRLLPRGIPIIRIVDGNEWRGGGAEGRRKWRSGDACKALTD